MFTIVYRPNFFLTFPIRCCIFIKQMSLFVVGGGGGGGGSVSTYNFMFYVNVRRLNNSVLTYFMRTHAFFFFVANAIVLSRVFRGHWSMC